MSRSDVVLRPSGHVRVARARIEDTAAVLAMVGRCSQMTLFHRFHGPTDGVAYTRRLFEDHPHQGTVMAWNGSVCVGFATLACDAEGVGHLGVLVEDAWQRRRVGTRLTAALVDDAVARGVSTLRADVLAEDRFILHLLHPIGPVAVSFDLGSFSVLVDLSRGQRANRARAAALAARPRQPGGHRSGTDLEPGGQAVGL